MHSPNNNKIPRFALSFMAALVVSFAASGALPVATPEVSTYADTEAVTNVFFNAGDAYARLFSLSLELDATESNNVSVAFGSDVNENGLFSASEVQWRVVSGPGRIVSRNDGEWAVSVEPTAPSGEVVVEAAFGNDSPIQPRFVLPIVAKRRIPIGACVVVDSTGNPVCSKHEIEERIRKANETYAQAGVEFYLSSPILFLNEPSFSVISEHNVKTNASGRISTWGVCPQVTNLLNRVDCGISNATVKLVWVSRIINGTPIAFTLRRRRCCIFSANYRASDSPVPHEIGHAMGLDDIYERRKRDARDMLVDGGLPVNSSVFDDLSHDWGESDGRAFYEESDTHSEIIKRCLMHGRDTGGIDIPYSRIEGFSATSRHVFDTMKVSIGASNIRED